MWAAATSALGLGMLAECRCKTSSLVDAAHWTHVSDKNLGCVAGTGARGR